MIGSPFMLLINLQITRKKQEKFLQLQEKSVVHSKKLPFIAKVNFWGKNVLSYKE